MRTQTLLLAITAIAAHAQAPAKLEFDVATVKPAAPMINGMIRVRMGGGPGSSDPGRLNYENVNLKAILTKAYDVKSYQINGPAWLDSERYDITAKVPTGTTKEQFAVMLQNLLADRLKLTLHRETKDLPAYALVVGKGGSKLKESVPVAPAAEPTPPQGPPPQINTPRQMGRDGFPVMPGGMGRGAVSMMMMPGRAKLTANGGSITRLAEMLEQQLDRAVVDETGLKGNYDFTLTFEPDPSRSMGVMGAMPAGIGRAMMAGGGGGDHQPDAEPAANLFTAVQEQLGLKLDSRKMPIELLVIDHLEKTPIEN